MARVPSDTVGTHRDRVLPSNALQCNDFHRQHGGRSIMLLRAVDQLGTVIFDGRILFQEGRPQTANGDNQLPYLKVVIR